MNGLINKKVCIISTVHNALDVRIFFKEAKSLHKAGYQISLIAKHPTSTVVDGIEIIGLRDMQSRIRRMIILPIQAFSIAIREKALLYHLHDPELIFVGLLLKILTRSVVIYDAHEDFPSTVFARDWIPDWLKPILSKLVNSFELTISSKFDAIITADPAVAQRFSEVHQEVTILYNVPPRKLVTTPPKAMRERTRSLVHIGSVSRSRGIWFLLEVIGELFRMEIDFQLDFYVNNTSWGMMMDFADQIANEGLSSYVNINKALPYPELLQELRHFRVGLIPFLDMEKYHKNIATKMFDYMASGLAIVASDLPPQRAVIETAGCGKLIEPEDPAAFACAIRDLLAAPERAFEMGERGWSVIQSQYCWEVEEEKLINLYDSLLQGGKQGLYSNGR